MAPFAPRHLLAFAIASGTCVWAYEARGSVTCPLRVEPPLPVTAWNDKAHEVESFISGKNELQHDCRSIRIEVQPEGNALLTFTTTDGRIAVRLLHSPEDIAPTVEALLVTLPVEKPLEVPPPAKPSPTLIPQIPPKKETSPLTLPLPVSTAPRMLFGFFAGGRLGVDASVFAPAVGIQALVQVAPWEIGIGAELNPLHMLLAESAPAGYAMRSFEGNFLVGRRFVSGPRAFRLGGSLGVGLVREETDADPAVKGRVNLDAFQPRVGLYGGMVVPREGHFRFYLGMYGDMTLWGLREKGTIKRDLPNLPRFGLGLILGMEVAP
jgi:hypothetical protein